MIIDAESKKDKKGLIVDIDIKNKKNRVVIYNIYIYIYTQDNNKYIVSEVTMSEKLKNINKNPNPDTTPDRDPNPNMDSSEINQLNALSEMSGKFNADKAKTLIEESLNSKEDHTNENKDTEIKGFEYLAVQPEKQEELTPRDAANEYLSILDDLSKDFSNPYYSEQRSGQHHYAVNITTDLGRKYSDNPHYRWSGYVGTEAGEKDGTMLRIASADSLIASEIGWRKDGEKASRELEKIDRDLADLDDEYAKKAF